VSKLNNSIYGLQAGVFTENLRNAYYAIDNLDVGGVMINDVPTFRIDLMPYGGLKGSGYGREGPKYAIEEMTEIKCVRFHL
jgi:acyl-CoA reductase-like NAD-dependent aldehyde dehydrogenase